MADNKMVVIEYTSQLTMTTTITLKQEDFSCSENEMKTNAATFAVEMATTDYPSLIVDAVKEVEQVSDFTVYGSTYKIYKVTLNVSKGDQNDG